MATLAASFVRDLEGLGTSSDEDDEFYVKDPNAISSIIPSSILLEPVVNALQRHIIKFGEGKGSHTVTDYLVQPHVAKLLQTVKEIMDEDVDVKIEKDILNEATDKVLQIDQEILTVTRFVSDLYSRQFPELASIVVDPVEYISLVKRAKYEVNFTKVEMGDLLSPQTQVAVNVAASMCTGSTLSTTEMDEVVRACDEGLDLLDARDEVLKYIERRMDVIAPSLSKILGRPLSGRLLTLGEGLKNLATMPAQNVMLLGTKRVASLGSSSSSATLYQGVLWHSDLIQSTPAPYRIKALRLLSGKVSLAARVDLSRRDPEGQAGANYRQQIIDTLQKCQEPPPPPLRRSLPKPKEGGGKSTRRGGRRIRKLKEKRGQTKLAADMNRVKFGPNEDKEEPVSD